MMDASATHTETVHRSDGWYAVLDRGEGFTPSNLGPYGTQHEARHRLSEIMADSLSTQRTPLHKYMLCAVNDAGFCDPYDAVAGQCDSVEALIAEWQRFHPHIQAKDLRVVRVTFSLEGALTEHPAFLAWDDKLKSAGPD